MTAYTTPPTAPWGYVLVVATVLTLLVVAAALAARRTR